MAGVSEFRASQGIVPFGVGAIVDFPDESLMMAGLDVWQYENLVGEERMRFIHAYQVLDGRLARRLSAQVGHRIKRFLAPLEAPERNSFDKVPDPEAHPRGFMPFVRFPEWYICPRCRVMKHIPWNTQSGDARLRCSSDKRRVEGAGVTCSEKRPNKQEELIPVRFVTVCKKGHIMDFPWLKWVHKKNPDCDATAPDLFLYSTGAAGLAGLKVACSKCNRQESMRGAFASDALDSLFPDGCPGNRPWLGSDNNELDCEEAPRTVQRGASNTYFASISTSILIPPYSEHLQKILDDPDIWAEIEDFADSEQGLRTATNAKARTFGLDPEILHRAVLDKLEQGEEDVDIGEASYRRAEYDAYLGNRPPEKEREDFDIQSVSVSDYETDVGQFFEEIVLIKRLRETMVLTGFTRLVPPDADTAQLAKMSERELNWLPGIAVRGEGIFVNFSKKRIDSWLGQKSVAERIVDVVQRSDQTRRERGLPDRDVGPELILIHTFAHLLIRQLSFDCGYDASSLKERIYVGGNLKDPMFGLLIYTASGDSEGTLGGLVRQGEPGRFESSVRASIENALICSSDPLCIESSGQGLNGLNLAACHSCSLLPETSCEEGNRYLDRALVIGTLEQPMLGFFNDIITI
jgi:hypothetical protein